MADAFSVDVSYYQVPADNTYPRKWFIFRACDGTFRDPAFAANLAWAERAATSGRITGYTVYAVYHPGVDIVAVVKSMVPSPSPHLTVMIDVESWQGQITGNHSDEITLVAKGFASWLGSRKRVLAYANQGDFQNLYPSRPNWLKLVVAAYSSMQPTLANMIGWQYSDGTDRFPVPAGYPRSTPPFGRCDHNTFPGLTAVELAAALGVAEALPVNPRPGPGPDPTPPPVDPLEELMGYYKDKADYEAALTQIVTDVVDARVRVLFTDAAGEVRKDRAFGHEAKLTPDEQAAAKKQGK